MFISAMSTDRTGGATVARADVWQNARPTDLGRASRPSTAAPTSILGEALRSGGKVRQEGEITQWNDERGFGFITPMSGGSRVFLHVSELPRGPRPSPGTRVSFLSTRGDRQRLRATNVQFVGDVERGKRSGGRGVPAVMAVALVFLAVIGLLAGFRLLPVFVVAATLLMSLVAFVLYRGDKSAAIQGARRTPESTLQVVSLLGGWPGALVAQRVYRHKTRKQPFQTVFWITVLANCAALAWMASGQPLPF